MTSTKMINRFIALTIFFLVPGMLFAQSGKIYGTVIDQASGEPLAGVEVTHLETGKQVITDFDGNFTISELPAGENKIVVSYISYEKKEFSAELDKADEEAVLNIKLTRTNVRPAKNRAEKITLPGLSLT